MHELRDRLARAVRRRPARRRAADQHRVVRLQARAAARRRPRVRLPVPAQPALGRRAAPARRAPTPPVRDYVLQQPETGPFLDELRTPVRAAAPGLRARGQVVPLDRGRLHRRSPPQRGRSPTSSARSAPSRSASRPHVHHRDVDAWRDAPEQARGRRARRRSRARRPRCAPSAATPASITAVVSVADDGGSSGRLAPRPRRPAARATSGAAWSRSPTTRRVGGRVRAPLRRRASSTGTRSATWCSSGWPRRSATSHAALDEAGRLLGAVGRVLPATTEPVVLKAERRRRRRGRGPGGGGRTAAGSGGSSSSRPTAPPRPDAAGGDRGGRPGRAAPPDRCTPASCRCSACPSCDGRWPPAPAPVVQVATCARRCPRPPGSTAPTTCAAVLDHGARVDRVPLPARRACSRSTPSAIRALGVEPVAAPTSPGPTGSAHDPGTTGDRPCRALL